MFWLHQWLATPFVADKNIIECHGYDMKEGVRTLKTLGKTKVYEQRCGEAPANVCFKSCDEAVPPCIMSEEEVVIPATERHAGDDCNEATAA